MSGSLPSQIAQLAELFAAGGFKDLRVETPGLSVHLSADATSARLGTAAPAAVPAAAPASVAASPVAAAPVSAPVAPVAAKVSAPHCAQVKAPNLGTFYRSPKPGAAPFVEIGQKVSAETEICLLEVMKLFTSVKAGVSGTIREVCVEDGVLVEGGQVLFLIESD